MMAVSTRPAPAALRWAIWLDRVLRRLLAERAQRQQAAVTVRELDRLARTAPHLLRDIGVGACDLREPPPRGR